MESGLHLIDVIVSGLLRSPENESGSTEEFEIDPEEILHIPFDDERDIFLGTSVSRLRTGKCQTDKPQSSGVTDDMDLD